MLSKLLIAFSLMALCVAIHAMGLTAVFRWMQGRRGAGDGTSGPPLGGWSASRAGRFSCTCCRFALGVLLRVAGRDAGPARSAFYFSAVTYTTTGYGDLVLPEEWRLVGGVEALTGILMCGLSTGIVLRRLHQNLRPQPRKRADRMNP